MEAPWLVLLSSGLVWSGLVELKRRFWRFILKLMSV